MALGLEAAYGVEGGWDALRNIIAERKKDEILKQHQEDQRQQFQLQWQQQEEARKFRELQLKALEADREERNKDRDLTRRMMGDQREATLRAQEEGRIQKRFEFLPTGYQANAQDYEDAKRISIEGLFKQNPLDPKVLSTTMAPGPLGGIPVAPQTYTYAGSAQSQEKAAKEKQDILQQQWQMANQRALLAAALAKPNVQITPSTAMPGGIAAAQVNPLAPGGLGISQFPGAAEGGGVYGGAATVANKAAMPVTQFINSLDALEVVGDKYNWKNLGIPAGITGWMARKGAITPPPGMVEMQSAVSDVRSFIGHERYGAALTAGEKNTLDQFVADSYTPGKVTKEMVAAVKSIEMDVLRRTQAGPFGPLQGTQGGGGGGGGFGLDRFLGTP